MKWKNKKNIQWEDFQNPKSKSCKEAKYIPLTHKYMTVHFPGLAQAHQIKIGGVKLEKKVVHMV